MAELHSYLRKYHCGIPFPCSHDARSAVDIESQMVEGLTGENGEDILFYTSTAVNLARKFH